MALTLPVTSSITRVEAGKPPEAASAEVGTDTTLIAVPTSSIREGINSVLWGEQTPWADDKQENTEAISVTTSSGASAEVMLSTCEADKTRRDMAMDSDIVG